MSNIATAELCMRCNTMRHIRVEDRCDVTLIRCCVCGKILEWLWKDDDEEPPHA